MTLKSMYNRNLNFHRLRARTTPTSPWTPSQHSIVAGRVQASSSQTRRSETKPRLA